MNPAAGGGRTARLWPSLRFYGGGMRIAPGALVDDGHLDVVIVGPLRRAELLARLPTVYWGAHLRKRLRGARRGS